MVVDHICPHHLHEFIEAFSCKTLEESIGVSGISYAVDYLIAVVVFFHHGINGVDVILKVSIHRDSHVADVLYRHESGKNCILVSCIVCKIDTGEKLRLRFMEFVNDLPCTVL